jgi:phospholipase/carboxylesterase
VHRGELLGFNYIYEEGKSDRTLLLLHGTGADENDLIPLGRSLEPQANLLSPRGRVMENGMPRFFRRFAEGVLDIDDLKARTHELAGFVAAARAEHGFDTSNVVGVGYSNGANIEASLLLLHPQVLCSAVLLRPMFPFEPDEAPDLTGVPVLIASGRNDPLIPPEQPDRLAEMLRKDGADVEQRWSDGGHPLERPEIVGIAQWMASRLSTDGWRAEHRP